jgi:tetratricopeptide (TPR) repeat protein
MVRIVKERGYVTKDFPFLEESVRKVMESVLEITDNYWDFAEKLAAGVIDPQTHPNLIYLALYHVSRVKNIKALHQIIDAHPELPIPFPFYYPSGNDYYHDEPIVERVIELNKNPVITFYMLMRLFRASDIGSPEEEQATQLIEKFLAEHPELRLHGADYIGHAGYRRKLSGQPQESFDMMMEALQLARESSDKWHQISLLTLLGEVAGQYVKGINTFSDAKKYLEEAVILSREINDKAGLANTLQTMCVFAYSRGELGEAYDCQLESIQIQGEIGEISVNGASNMAGLYRKNGEEESAREMETIVRAAEDKLGPYAYFGDAGRYISEGNLREAEKSLNRARELTMSLGLETALGRLYGLEGKLLRAKGDMESAMDSYQRELDINERAGRQLRVRFSLVRLVKMEVEMFTPTRENRDDEYSGPWMKRLEEEVENNDIPGIYGNFLLLQSELRMRQGRHDEAEDILDSAIELTDNSAMRFLHREALAMKEKWVEEGVISLDALQTPKRE